MPRDNKFRHQVYSDGQPGAEWQLLQASQPDSREFNEWPAIQKRFAESSVAAVYLVHGTFVGDDALGLIRPLSHINSALGEKLRGLQKRVVDRLAEDSGNYTTQFANHFKSKISCPVRLLRWSSENHHIARAHAAIALIDDLIGQGLSSHQRVLLWGHSHAGNVFALITNLLASKRPARKRFFRACRSYFRHGASEDVVLPVWKRVKSWLEAADIARELPQLDFVTFGTPIRYGWDAGGYSQLLHVVHHHPAEDLPPYLTRLPLAIEDVLEALDGDYVQHWGIAGTNLAPGILPLGTWLADFRLGRFLQRNLAPRWLTRRLRLGQRVPAEGSTLLIDYGRYAENDAQPVVGHAVYTRLAWLPFHAKLVGEEFYSKGRCQE